MTFHGINPKRPILDEMNILGFENSNHGHANNIHFFFPHKHIATDPPVLYHCEEKLIIP